MNTSESSDNFYENLDLRFTEVAILMEDIILPPLPPLSKILAGEVDKFRAEELYTDMIGKFCIPILFPLEEEPKNKKMPAPTVRNIQSDCKLKTIPYEQSNYVELNIPKYILMNFTGKVLSGTRFLIIFVGGSIKISDIRVTGVKDYVQIDQSTTGTN